MTIRQESSGSLKRLRATGAVVCLSFSGFVSSCASPGPPRPPSLHLPGVVTDLKADRIDDRVELHWTTPAKTTDGQAIKGALSATVCREDGIVKGNKEPVCTPFATVPVVPGPSQAVDRLPAGPRSDSVRVIGYKVSLLNAKGRSAGPSKAVYSAAGVSPGPVAGLQVKGLSTGVEVTWVKELDEVAVGRELVLDADGKPPVEKAGSRGASGGRRGESLHVELVTNPLAARAFQEQTKATDGPGDPGGVEDRDAVHGMGETYEYTAWRFRTIYGPDDLPIVLRGPVSAPVRYTVHDTFPPQVPRGLAAVPGLAGTHSVDLSWRPVPDADLAGYLVYRRTATDGSWTRLTAVPNPATAYQDTSVAAGETYFYRVTSVDQTGNESKPSAEIRQTPEP